MQIWKQAQDYVTHMQTAAAITIVTHQLSFIVRLFFPLSFLLQNQGEGLEAKTVQEGMHTDLASCKKTQFRTHVDSLALYF